MDKAVFFDRDGTLNRDDGYTYKTQSFELLPGVIGALKLLKNNFKFFIVTNQSGVGRGYYTLDDVHKFNEKMVKELEKHDIAIKRVYICPHHPDETCECRKPGTKYIKDAKKEFNLDLKNSWTIGDHPHDVQMGKNAGCKTVYLLTGHGEKHKKELDGKGIKPDFISKNIYEAAKFIIKNSPE